MREPVLGLGLFGDVLGFEVDFMNEVGRLFVLAWHEVFGLLDSMFDLARFD